MPPNEKPTQSQAASPNRHCSPCSTRPGSASASVPCKGAAESPKPGKSGTSTQRPASTSAVILRSQCVQLPLPPCSNTSGGKAGWRVAWPQTCQTNVPVPQGVSVRVAVFRSACASGGNCTEGSKFIACSSLCAATGPRQSNRLSKPLTGSNRLWRAWKYSRVGPGIASARTEWRTSPG